MIKGSRTCGQEVLVKERNSQYRAFIDARKDERRKLKDTKILLMLRFMTISRASGACL